MENNITKKGDSRKFKKERQLSRNIRMKGEFLVKEEYLLEHFGVDSPALYRMLITEKYRLLTTFIETNS